MQFHIRGCISNIVAFIFWGMPGIKSKSSLAVIAVDVLGGFIDTFS